jgi:hypothetical protein
MVRYTVLHDEHSILVHRVGGEPDIRVDDCRLMDANLLRLFATDSRSPEEFANILCHFNRLLPREDRNGRPGVTGN